VKIYHLHYEKTVVFTMSLPEVLITSFTALSNSLQERQLDHKYFSQLLPKGFLLEQVEESNQSGAS